MTPPDGPPSASPDAADASARSSPSDGRPERVAVVGGGAVGLTAAVDLRDRGVDVTVFERSSVGAGASGRAAGVLYDAYAEAVDARVAARAMERFRELSGSGGFAFEPCPYVMLAREGDPTLAEAIEGAAGRMRERGRPVETLDADALGDRFPALRTDDVAAAAAASNAGHADPSAYVDLLATRLRRAGGEIREDAPVAVSVDPPGVVPRSESDDPDASVEAFDAVAVAAGASTGRLLADAGVDVPLKAYRAQALVSRGSYDGPMWYDASAEAYARPHPAGLLGGDGVSPGAVDPEAWDPEADEAFVAGLSGTLRHRTAHDPAVDRAWAGVCTATPDGDPLLGELRPGVYVAAGWHGHGFMRAPATGEALARNLCDEGGIGPFDPARFDGDESFEIREGMAVDPAFDDDPP
ncbi:NAD(P)/FAD-dependent oxidoreductase [Candidatus Halobonum tyrrellensis]|uniref:Sarcosine oxidase beta subunit n=1 Tax=Candidatus Halobonum tyrrellensis G22 TaxID=1324957 RepID=V4HK32_9EURY|nr:FAD-dependent oxidoreductase [Candidatus Halobonum tyrrellensis]ESP88279.1 sarcosine oxidase beta subunit [Candidatus Halobonum tyrrellensis G22]